MRRLTRPRHVILTPPPGHVRRRALTARLVQALSIALVLAAILAAASARDTVAAVEAYLAAGGGGER
jgi:hypothetical protein